MRVKSSKSTPDKRRKYDDAFKAEALRLASGSRSTQAAALSPKLIYRWQQAQLVAEVGSVAVARDPEVRQLCAQLKRAEQELDSLKSLGHLQPANSVSTYRYIAQRRSLVPVRQLYQVLRVSASAYYAWQRS